MSTLYSAAVIMPIHNAKQTLKRSIDSVFQQQNLPTDLEEIIVICVFNGNSDEENKFYQETITESYQNSSCDKFSFNIKIEKENGIVPALNTGLSIAQRFDTKYIFRQDADDMWYPEKLSKQLNLLETNPDIDIVGTGIQFVTTSLVPNGIFKYPKNDWEVKNWMLSSRNAIAHPTVGFRTSILKRVGGYDDTFPLAEDFNLWLRCIKWFKFANLDEVLLDYTQNPNPNYNPLSPQIASSNMVLALRHFGAK